MKLVSIAIALLVSGCAATAVDRFPSLPGEAIPDSKTELFIPDADPTRGPYPAVVLLHTCGGVGEHQNQWIYRLTWEKFVVLRVDSFGPRGARSVCGSFQVSVDQVAADALAAAAHLRRLKFVDPDRIYAVGHSYGAMAGLRLASAGYLQRQTYIVPFRGIVAFYPDCLANPNAPPTAAARGNNFYSDIATPLLLLLGGADSEAPSGNCASHAEGRIRAGQPVSYKIFPGATHAYDQHAPRLGYRFDLDAVDGSWDAMRAFFAK